MKKRRRKMASKRYDFQCVKQYVKLRKANKKKQQDIAELTGISVHAIRSYETGRRVPSVATMEILAKSVGGTGLSIDGWK